VGEVDQLEDPVDQRVAESDERVKGALRGADQQDAEEPIGVLNEIDDQPCNDEANQDEPEEPGGKAAEVPPRRDGPRVRLGGQGSLLEGDWGRTLRPSPVVRPSLDLGLPSLGH
jgi:hypothetical protein